MGGNNLYASTDGSYWTSGNTGLGRDYRGVCWNGAQYNLVGDYGMVAVSVDGVTWDEEIALSSAMLLAVVWDGTKYLAVGSNGSAYTAQAAVSTDGVVWTDLGSFPPEVGGQVGLGFGNATAVARSATLGIWVAV
jgi:hypothetical protein